MNFFDDPDAPDLAREIGRAALERAAAAAGMTVDAVLDVALANPAFAAQLREAAAVGRRKNEAEAANLRRLAGRCEDPGVAAKLRRAASLMANAHAEKIPGEDDPLPDDSAA